tara:strand:+ start:3743 stop:4678 length:936 start_codon:yes stop_codon:yes gene_type:complete
MKKIKSLIIGTGVIGAYLSKLLIQKRHDVTVTSRFLKKNYKNYKSLKISHKVKFKKLNILKKKNIKKIIKDINPENIFYLAGQSSIPKSFVLPKETKDSNFLGAKNFLEVINKENIKTKFFKANSGYIFKPKNGIINFNCALIKPSNPYVKAQQSAYKLIKKFRNKKIDCYSLIFMQIESPLRDKNFLIKKVCSHAKQKKKVEVGNINTLRDYSWIEDIVKGVYYSTLIKPCDIILSSGKKLSGKDILKYAYKLNKLNFNNFYSINKKFIRKKENKIVIGSNFSTIKKFAKFNWKPKIYKQKLIKKIYDSI